MENLVINFKERNISLDYLLDKINKAPAKIIGDDIINDAINIINKYYNPDYVDAIIDKENSECKEGIVCTYCNFINSKGSKFCNNCGKKLFEANNNIIQKNENNQFLETKQKETELNKNILNKTNEKRHEEYEKYNTFLEGNNILEEVYNNLEKFYKNLKNDNRALSLRLLPSMIIIGNTLTIGLNRNERILPEKYYTPFSTSIFISYFFARFTYLFQKFLFNRNLYAVNTSKANDVIGYIRQTIVQTVSHLHIDEDAFLELSKIHFENFNNEDFGDELNEIGFYFSLTSIIQNINEEIDSKHLEIIRKNFENFDIMAKNVIDELIIKLTN